VSDHRGGAGRQSSRVWVVARTDLRQLRQSPDFWGPMLALAAIFFIIAPAVLRRVPRTRSRSSCSPRSR